MDDYVARIVDRELDELFSALPALSLEGPKGVGKTATALRRSRMTFRLDEAGERSVIEADPGRIVESTGPTLIDEWQRVPEVWDVVRRAVDDGAHPGSFLLTGSAAPAAVPTHTGAGRIVTVRMRPLSLAERGLGPATVSLRALMSGDRAALVGATNVTLDRYADEIVQSGFPGLRHLSDRPLRSQLDGYLHRIVEREFADAGLRVRNPSALRRWMASYAAATSTTATYDTIRDAATSGEGDKLAKSTTQPYRDVLQRLWILDPLPAWLPTQNHIARLSSPPKHHLADPALAARLLGADVETLLAGRGAGFGADQGALLGQLFESLVGLSVRVYAQASECSVGHLRTRGGEREVDLVVQRTDGRVVAFEVKLGRVVDDHDVRHLRWLQGQMGDALADAVVISTGSEAYRRRDGIGVVPAALLGP